MRQNGGWSHFQKRCVRKSTVIKSALRLSSQGRSPRNCKNISRTPRPEGRPRNGFILCDHCEVRTSQQLSSLQLLSRRMSISTKCSFGQQISNVNPRSIKSDEVAPRAATSSLFMDRDQIGRASSIKKRLGESHPNAIDYYTLLAVPTLERIRGSTSRPYPSIKARLFGPAEWKIR